MPSTVSDDMVERIAEALWQSESLRASDRLRRTVWDDLLEQDRAKWRGLARAAIAAMRQPTDAMEKSGNRALTDNGLSDVESDDATVAWETMIDAALSEPTEAA